MAESFAGTVDLAGFVGGAALPDTTAEEADWTAVGAGADSVLACRSRQAGEAATEAVIGIGQQVLALAVVVAVGKPKSADALASVRIALFISPALPSALPTAAAQLRALLALLLFLGLSIINAEREWKRCEEAGSQSRKQSTTRGP